MIFEIRLHTIAILGVMLLCLLGACQAFDASDDKGTLEAQSIMYNTQTVVIQTDSFTARTQVAQTIEARETQVAEVDNVNNQLLTTLRAVITPTVAVVQGAAANSVTSPNISSTQEFLIVQGNLQFVLTGLSTTVSVNDGCVINPRTSFGTSESRIYATVQAYNILAQTLMQVEWFKEDELVYSDSWRVDNNYDQICIWFYIPSSDVNFTQGRWSAQFMANGTTVQQPMTFTFTEDMDDMDDMSDG